MMEGTIGIVLGIIFIVGIQIFCYTFFDEDNNKLAIVVGLSCLILGILASILLMKMFPQ